MIAEQLANLPVGNPNFTTLTDVRVTSVTQEQVAKQLGTTPKAKARQARMERLEFAATVEL